MPNEIAAHEISNALTLASGLALVLTLEDEDQDLIAMKKRVIGCLLENDYFSALASSLDSGLPNINDYIKIFRDVAINIGHINEPELAEAFNAKLKEHNVVDKIIVLASEASPSQISAMESLIGLINYSSAQDAVIAKEGFIEMAISRIAVGDKIAGSLAYAALAFITNAAMYSSCQTLIVEKQAVPLIIAFLAQGDLTFQSAVINALAHIAAHYIGKSEITAAQIIPKVIDLMRIVKDTHYRLMTFRLLSNVASDTHSNIEVMLEEGLLSVLKEFLDISELRSDVIILLIWIATQDKRFSQAIVEAMIIPKLFDLLKSSDQDISDCAYISLCYCCSKYLHHYYALLSQELYAESPGADITEADLISNIVRFISSDRVEHRFGAAYALSILAQFCSDIRTLITHSELIAKTVCLLDQPETELGALTVFNILMEPKDEEIKRLAKEALREAGGIPKLAALLDSPREKVQESALELLALYCINHAQNRQILKAAGAVELITHFESHPEARIKDFANQLLQDLSEAEVPAAPSLAVLAAMALAAERQEGLAQENA
jgi:hypothetical protein